MDKASWRWADSCVPAGTLILFVSDQGFSSCLASPRLISGDPPGRQAHALDLSWLWTAERVGCGLLPTEDSRHTFLRMSPCFALPWLLIFRGLEPKAVLSLALGCDVPSLQD
jgi:hypothetical protein